MFGMLRNIRRNVRNKVMEMRFQRMPGRSMTMGRNKMNASGDVQPSTARDMNFAHKFDATDEELANVRDLNETDLYSDGSSKYSRMEPRRHDGGDTESLNYPHTPDLKGKGSRAA